MITELKDDDLSYILEIEKTDYINEGNRKEDILFELSNPYGKIFVYKDKEIKGYICVEDYTDRYEINSLCVKKAEREKGIGNELVKYLNDLADEKKYRNITLEVNKNNVAAINLYRKNGFEIWATRKNYYGNQDAYLMGRGDK